ncbi:hypothetical protein [Natronoglycomyces albus]|uniref:Uncharacterized protein n=1 Tax=Natronoglycomyces albus TaxID=2811108 RepID=A0A895XST9_9ACTN|nr:hypothetical protein [Natronoglycomyces albus]QSB05606.1 hypothetical protein JQS30_01355 [Natronoglycomyces albus]
MNDTQLPDFTDAPRQSGFGTNADGDWFSPSDAGNAILSRDGVKQFADPYKAATSAPGNVQQIISGDDIFGGLNGCMDNLKGLAEASKATSKLSEIIGDKSFNPLSWLVEMGIDALLHIFQPLDDLLGLVTGNEDRMKVSGDMWGTVAEGLIPIAEQIEATIESDLADWHGCDADAARTRLGEASTAIRGGSFGAVCMQQIMLLAAEFAKYLEGKVRKFIADKVSWAILNWATSAAASVVTFGASVVQAIVSTIIKVTSGVMKILKWINDFIQKYSALVKIINAVLKVFSVLEKFFKHLHFVKAGVSLVGGAVNATR